VKISVGMVFIVDVEQIFTEHDVENKTPYYQFKIKSIDDIETGSEKLTNGRYIKQPKYFLFHLW
jgi:hypothetical protein